MTNETTYLLERSSREAVRALQSHEPRAAVVHQELCLLYTARALATMAAFRLTSRPAPRDTGSGRPRRPG